MALLTADDVLNKKFQPTKFREGYDQDEVDDFLDEVVNTLRVVAAENDELKSKLAAAEAALAASGAAPAVEAPAEAAPEAEEPAAPEVEAAPEAEAEAEAPAPTAPAAEAAPAPDQAQSAAGMLALAQKLHDEYVSNGQAEGDRIVGEARTTAEQLVRDAEETKSRTLGQLEEERVLLERKIDELRSFERDYRTRLKSYLESLLNEVEGRGAASQAL